MFCIFEQIYLKSAFGRSENACVTDIFVVKYKKRKFLGVFYVEENGVYFARHERHD
jgi:hypothetical protein